MSCRYKCIEQTLGAKLFERTTPLKLTYAGERFLDYANRLVQAETEMMSEFQDIADERKGQIICICWLRMNIKKIVSDRKLTDNLNVIQLNYPSASYTLGIGYMNGHYLSNAAKDLIRLMEG